MYLLPVGKIIEIKGKRALVEFENERKEIDISLLKNIKINDKVICAGDVAIERIKDRRLFFAYPLYRSLGRERIYKVKKDFELKSAKQKLGK